MKIHILKTAREVFGDLTTGAKKAEFRKNDRSFKVGDILYLREYVDCDDYKDYSGNELFYQITHIQTGFGIPEDYVMLSIEKLDKTL